MEKDKTGGPAFPFYAQDFLVGVMHLENDEIGAYIKLLAYQWVNGPIHEKRLKFLIGENMGAIWEAIKDKFIQANESFYNLRLEEEREKRIKFSKKQSENARKRTNKKPNENQKGAKQEPKKANALPLENENENENENESKKENKVDNEKVIQIFNSVCKKLPAVQKLTPKRISAINARNEEYNLKTIGEVFILVSQSPFLNGDNDREWRADFDWIMNPNNFIKILEKKYNGKKSNSTQSRVKISDNLQEKIARGLQS